MKSLRGLSGPASRHGRHRCRARWPPWPPSALSPERLGEKGAAAASEACKVEQSGSSSSPGPLTNAFSYFKRVLSRRRKAERSAAGQGGKEKEGQGAGPRGLATPRQLLLARLGAFVEPSASFCLASLWHLAPHLARSLAESAKLLPGRSLSKPSERGICFLLTSPLLCSQPRAKNARLGWHRMWLSGQGAAQPLA